QPLQVPGGVGSYMLRFVATATWLLMGSAEFLAAQGFGSISGTVRDTAGSPLAGAEVTLERRRVVTTPQGSFRLDSVQVGTHLITIRLVGYAPYRSPIAVHSVTSSYDFVLHRATRVLPTLIAEAQRTGIYGTVGDTSLVPLAGVHVQLGGRGGGDTFTDSSGRFAFPEAVEGQYVLRAVHPGYGGERRFVTLKKGTGMELAIRLSPSKEPLYRADEVAVQELGLRLAANLSWDRLNSAQLDRY